MVLIRRINICENSYAELDKDIKNKISHRFRAIDKMIEHFSWVILKNRK